MTRHRRTHRTTLAVVAAVSFLVSVTPVVTPSDAVAPGQTISWLTTGDSYSAGEGVKGNIGECAQSNDAWGQSAAQILDRDERWPIDTTQFSACTGHLVQDMYNERPNTKNPASLWDWGHGQPGAPTSDRFDVITMSFGGNDIGFADIILDCQAAPFHKYDSWPEVIDRGVWFGPVLAKDIVSTVGAEVIPFLGDDCDTQQHELERRVDMLFEPNPCGSDAWRDDRSEFANYDCELVIDADIGLTGSIIDFWLHVVATSLAGGGVLVVQGYPALFAESDEWGLGQGLRCNGVTRGDANMLGEVTRHLDERLDGGVDAANRILGEERIIYSSLIDLYADGGHSLCGPGDDWINGSITLTRDEPFLIPMPVTSTVAVNPGFRFRHLGAFHHNAAGNMAAAQQVAELLVAHGQPTPQQPHQTGDRTLFAGHWSGPAQGASRRFTVSMSLTDTSGLLRGTVEHPELPCSGEVVELLISNGALILSPTFTPESECIHNGTTRLTFLGPDRLRYEWFDPGSDRVDTGELTRVTGGSGGGAAECWDGSGSIGGYVGTLGVDVTNYLTTGNPAGLTPPMAERLKEFVYDTTTPLTEWRATFESTDTGYSLGAVGADSGGDGPILILELPFDNDGCWTGEVFAFGD